MFSIRNIGGVALFLFGTTFLWLMPFYAAKGTSTTGAAGVTAGVLAATGAREQNQQPKNPRQKPA